MNEWYEASQLAGLPGLPVSARSVRRRAEKSGWQVRPRRGRGGGVEYHISNFPLETQQYLREEFSPARRLKQARKLNYQVLLIMDEVIEALES